MVGPELLEGNPLTARYHGELLWISQSTAPLAFAAASGLFPCCLWRDASGPCPWTAKSGSDVGHGFILGLWCSCAPLFVLVLVPLHRGFDGLLVGQLPDP